MQVATKVFVVFAILLTSLAPAQSQWRHVETLRYDWAGSGNPATFILEVPSDFDAGGDFSRLRVLMPGHSEFALLDEDGLANFHKDVCRFKKFGFCKHANLVSSDHLFFYRVPSGPPLLLLFGWGYASSPGSFHVLMLNSKGDPQEILSLKEFDFEDLIDVNGDGNAEFVGKKCLSQEWGNHLLTYDPYSVYLLPTEANGTAKYDLKLSKQYNLENYYGWAGPDCREDVAVVLHPPGGGKPIILNSKEAEKLSGKK
jgi:hypothetical protein